MVLGAKKLTMRLSTMQSPVCHTICQLQTDPKQACANKSFDSNKMPLSLLMTCAKGAASSSQGAGSLDHLTNEEGKRLAADERLTSEREDRGAPYRACLLGGQPISSPVLFSLIEA